MIGMSSDLLALFEEAFKDCIVTPYDAYILIVKEAYWAEPIVIRDYRADENALPVKPGIARIIARQALSWPEAAAVAERNDFWIIRDQLDAGIKKEIEILKNKPAREEE